ncbi:hypothetical protein D3C84_335380 [compost metagenome]
MTERFEARHRQCRCGFQLTPVDRLDAGADDLGGIGAEVDDHRQHRRLPFGNLHAQGRQAEEDEKQLHQEWRVADQLDVDRENPRERPDVPRPHQRPDDAQPHAEHSADGGQLKGEQRTAQQQIGVVHHRQEIELISHKTSPARRIRDRPAAVLSARSGRSFPARRRSWRSRGSG